MDMRDESLALDDDGTNAADLVDGEGKQTPLEWLRLILATACLGAVAVLAGQRFVDYVVHHLWNQTRNSPAALIVPVVAVQFLWILAHIHTGGFIARLKIGFGATAMCMALFAPNLQSGGGTAFDLRQLCALLLASWVFVDGWLDRRSNLKADSSSPHLASP
ncbi:MAG: hypothetical protein H7X95_03085 [Deltaproteobacteria bacterium]|nr:hypothetical protein [Deltaproteobacteria bacterium]